MTTIFEPDNRALELPIEQPPAARTTVTSATSPLAAPQTPRRIGKMSRDDAMTMGGAAISALCLTFLIFGRLTPWRGAVGFVIVAFALYVFVYAVLTALTETRPAVVDRVMTSLMGAATAIAIFALATVVIFTIYKGWGALFKWNLYTQDMSLTGPLDPLSQGGIAHAIVGTLIITFISLILTVPLSVICAVYLTESRSRMSGLVRTIVTAMTALPSILAGLFIFATWILILGFERSGLAAAIAISIMMVPIIIRSADVVLRLVPGNLREASSALGAPQWRTVWHVVLPTARSGLMTSVILGVARGIGETAPILLTAGFTQTMNVNPRNNAMVSLPLAAFEFVRSPQPTQVARGFATAAVLMILVLILFSVARVLGGRAPGNLSKRQSRRAAARSVADLQRIESSH
jgi:phosphate transport system permease protein